MKTKIGLINQPTTFLMDSNSPGVSKELITARDPSPPFRYNLSSPSTLFPYLAKHYKQVRYWNNFQTH
jgi:hypothetical protein